MALITPKEIKKDSLVSIGYAHVNKYPEHNGKMFKVLDIDEENYCELEWINVNSSNRIAYIPKSELVISR